MIQLKDSWYVLSKLNTKKKEIIKIVRYVNDLIFNL